MSAPAGSSSGTSARSSAQRCSSVRTRRSNTAALIALGFYSSLIAGVIPQPQISWEGHLFGLLAGVLASKWLAEPRVPKGEEPYTPEPWELDEPWNIA